MLPVTRANLDKICCTCLVTICQLNQKAYDVNIEKDLLKILEFTVYKDVLRNPLNRQYINEYCIKVCDICFFNAKKAFLFRETYIESSLKLKYLLENKKRTKGRHYYCRVCLSRQHMSNNDNISTTYIKLIDDFSGISEVTNKLLTNYGSRLLPKKLCERCLEELQTIEEFQLLSKCSFEYIVSEISKRDNVSQEPSSSVKDKTTKKCDLHPQNETKIEEILLKCEQEDTQYQETLYNQTAISLADPKKEKCDIDVTNSVVNEALIDVCDHKEIILNDTVDSSVTDYNAVNENTKMSGNISKNGGEKNKIKSKRWRERLKDDETKLLNYRLKNQERMRNARQRWKALAEGKEDLLQEKREYDRIRQRRRRQKLLENKASYTIESQNFCDYKR